MFIPARGGAGTHLQVGSGVRIVRIERFHTVIGHLVSQTGSPPLSPVPAPYTSWAMMSPVPEWTKTPTVEGRIF